MKIYVVTGTTGEYSDRSEWLVKAFTDEKKAEEFVNMASGLAREIELKRESRYSGLDGIDPSEYAFDPHFSMYDTGTFYTYDSVELEG